MSEPSDGDYFEGGPLSAKGFDEAMDEDRPIQIRRNNKAPKADKVEAEPVQDHEMTDARKALSFFLLASFNGDNSRALRWLMYLHRTFSTNEIRTRLSVMTGLEEEKLEPYIKGASVPLPVVR